MTGPLRSRFQDDARRSSKSEGNSVGILTYAGQILLLLFTLGCGAAAVMWLVNDTSGEYRGYNDQLGQVTISLVRHAASVSGQLTVGDQEALPKTDGDIAHGNQIKLTFQANTGANKLNYAVVSGQIVNGTLKGTLTTAGNSFPIALQRDALSSMFRQIQEYVPFAS